MGVIYLKLVGHYTHISSCKVLHWITSPFLLFFHHTSGKSPVAHNRVRVNQYSPALEKRITSPHAITGPKCGSHGWKRLRMRTLLLLNHRYFPMHLSFLTGSIVHTSQIKILINLNLNYDLGKKRRICIEPTLEKS